MAVELAGRLEINKESGILLSSSDVVANDTAGLDILEIFVIVPKIQELLVWAQPQIKREVELELGVQRDAAENI